MRWACEKEMEELRLFNSRARLDLPSCGGSSADGDPKTDQSGLSRIRLRMVPTLRSDLRTERVSFNDGGRGFFGTETETETANA